MVLHSGIDANGMSSETLDLRRDLDRGRRPAPPTSTSPAWPRRPRTSRCSRPTPSRTSTTPCGSSAELTDVPVPAVSHMEPTGDVLGTPFFLMDRVDGRHPAGRAALQLRRQLAARRRPTRTSAGCRTPRSRSSPTCTRSPTPQTTFAFLDPHQPGATPLARNLARVRAWYDFAVADIGRSPLAERGLDWLEAHLPRPRTAAAATPSCAGATAGSAT